MTAQDFPTQPLRRLHAERMPSAGPPLPRALLAVAEKVRTGLGTKPLTYAGVPPHRIELTLPALRTWLDEVHRQRSAGIPAPVTLAAGPDLPAGATLTYEAEPWVGTGVEYVWCSLPDSLVLPVDGMLAVVAAVAIAFGAHRGAVEDDALMVRYRGGRAAERALEALPEELRAYVPIPAAGPDGGVLPQLLVPQEFDRRRVPDAVWWINVWDAVEVATLGQKAILQAPWARVVELPQGGLALAATEEPTQAGNPEHVARLGRILDVLDLRAAQEAHRYR